MKKQITMSHSEAEEITNPITAAPEIEPSQAQPNPPGSWASQNVLNIEEDCDGDNNEMLWTSTACYTSDIDNEELPSSNCQEMDYSNEAQLHQ